MNKLYSAEVALLLLCAPLTICATHLGNVAPRYQVVDLSGSVPGSGADGVAINNAGKAVLTIGVPGPVVRKRSFIYDGIAATEIIGPCPSGVKCSTQIVDINDLGDFVTAEGYANFAGEWVKIPAWSDPGTDSSPAELSATGAVTGYGTRRVSASEYQFTFRAFVWKGRNFVDLGSAYEWGLSGMGGYSYGRAINSSGLVVGISETRLDVDCIYPGDTWRAAVFRGAGISLIGSCYSEANDVNDYGDIVGSSNFIGTMDYIKYPFIYSRGQLRAIAQERGVALKINNLRTVIGTLTSRDVQFVWGKAFGLRDVMTLIENPNGQWSRFKLRDISDSGVIIGQGFRGSSSLAYPVLLVPVAQ